MVVHKSRRQDGLYRDGTWYAKITGTRGIGVQLASRYRLHGFPFLPSKCETSLNWGVLTAWLLLDVASSGIYELSHER